MGEELITSTTKSGRVCQNTDIPQALNLNVSANLALEL